MTSATLSRSASFPASRPDSAAPARTAPRRNILLRLLDAIAESNRRKAERQIAEYIRRNGGALTDTLERGIERTFL